MRFEFREVLIFPADIREKVVGGFGLFKGENPYQLFMTNDMIKLYHKVGEYYPFIFLGNTFYFNGIDIRPFIIENNNITFKDVNPLLVLISITPDSWWKKPFFKELLKSYVKANFSKLKLKKYIIPTLIDKLFFRDANLIDKYLRKAINNFVEIHLDLLRDIFSLARVSNEQSSLKVFKLLENEITNPTIFKRVKHKEFIPYGNIKGFEIHIKLLGNEEITKNLIKKLTQLFEVKILYDPKKHKGKSKLYKISVLIREDKEKFEINQLDIILRDFLFRVIDNSLRKHILLHLAWHLAKKFMRVKRIFIEIYTPPHFKELVLEGFREAGLYAFPREEIITKKGLCLILELWCDYKIFETKNDYTKKMLTVSPENIEDVDYMIYEKVFPQDFCRDYLLAFMKIRNKIHEKYGYVPWIFRFNTFQ